MKTKIKSQLRKVQDWFQTPSLKFKAFYWKVATQLQKKEFWSYYHLAKVQLQQQNWQEAELSFRHCLSLDNTLALAHHELADVLQQQAKFEEAAAAYRQAIALNPEFSWSHHNLGDALRHQQDWHGAILAYKNASNLAPDCFETYHNLAEAYSHTHQWEEAVIAYKKAINLCQNQGQFMFQLLYGYAGVLLRLKDTYTLSEVYLQTIEVDPTFSWFYHFVFWKTLKEENRLCDAEVAYKEALRKYPNSTEVYINLGEALSHQDKISDAIPYYQKALQENLKHSYPKLAALCDSSSQIQGFQTAPDFIVLGAQKAGTSSLYMYLTQHPKVIPAIRKEMEFWSWKYRRGHEWYFAHFPPLPTDRTFLTGEACPGYLDFHVTAERIQEFLPSVKFMVLLRNPVDRAISHYYHWVRRQQEPLPLAEAIAAKRKELEDQGNAWDLPSNYLARGIYVEFIKHWLSLFPRKQFLFLGSEAFYQNPSKSLNKVHEFLGISHHPLKDFTKYNSGSYRPAEAEIRQELEAFYKPYNEELEALLDHEFHWSN